MESTAVVPGTSETEHMSGKQASGEKADPPVSIPSEEGTTQLGTSESMPPGDVLSPGEKRLEAPAIQGLLPGAEEQLAMLQEKLRGTGEIQKFEDDTKPD